MLQFGHSPSLSSSNCHRTAKLPATSDRDPFATVGTNQLFENGDDLRSTRETFRESRVHLNLQDGVKIFRVVDTRSDFVFSTQLSDEDCLKTNVEWLYNEYLKARIKHVGDDVSVIPCLQTINNNLVYDSLLTKSNVLLAVFPNLLDLEPYYMETIRTIEFSSFKVLALIGKGAFSKVFVVRKRDSGDIFAMKVMKKKQFIIRDKEEYIFTEKDILSSTDHPNITNVYHAFQSNGYVFFVMDFYEGGDLNNLLKIKGSFTEDEARFYLTEVITALKYLHDQNILYRDLKPENIMLRYDGHIKLVDFGLSKCVKTKQRLTHSFVGSDGYIAPEIKLHRGHNFLNDVYAVGVLLYDMLHCCLPFNRSQRKVRNQEQISQMHNSIHFKKDLSVEAQDLMSRLLCLEPERRLGGEDDISAILFHPWFKKSYEHGLSQYNNTHAPPHLPDISKYQFDVSLIQLTEQALCDIKADAEDKNINHYTHYESFEFNTDSQTPKKRLVRSSTFNPSLSQNSQNGLLLDDCNLVEETTDEQRHSASDQKKNIRVFKNKTKHTRDNLSLHLQLKDRESPAEKGGFFSFFF